MNPPSFGIYNTMILPFPTIPKLSAVATAIKSGFSGLKRKAVQGNFALKKELYCEILASLVKA